MTKPKFLGTYKVSMFPNGAYAAVNGNKGFFGHPLVDAVRPLNAQEIKEIKRSRKSKLKHEARLRALFPWLVDISLWNEKVEDVRAPYKHLDDPITLWPHVRQWLADNVRHGDTPYPFNCNDTWARSNSLFEFKTEEAAAASIKEFNR